MNHILIDAERLQQALRTQSDWLVFDVRHDLSDHEAGRRAYIQGHIPGAIYLDHERQLSATRTGRNGRHPLPSLQHFTSLMRGLGLRPESQVAVYDASGGMFAAHLWWMLRWMGHEHVVVLDGGWPTWLAARGEVEQTETSTSPEPADAKADGIASSPSMPTVDAQQVLENLSQPRFTVLDARAPERYRGEVEPMDPVAGHIPGALNRPHSHNLAADGRFKRPEQLREEFAALLQGRRPEQVVHQCGSGITASHNLLAMEVAGLPGSSLYPGSWSEWCSDPSRPVATGSQPS